MVSVPFSQLVYRDIRIRGSLACNPIEARQMLDFVIEHGISVKTLAVNGLGQIPELAMMAYSGKMQGKGIVIVDQAQITWDKMQGRGTV